MKIYLLVLMIISSIATSCKPKISGSVVKETSDASSSGNSEEYTTRPQDETSRGTCVARYQWDETFDRRPYIRCTVSEEETMCDVGSPPSLTDTQRVSYNIKDLGEFCNCRCLPASPFNPAPDSRGNSIQDPF